MGEWADEFDLTGRVGWDEGRDVWNTYSSGAGRPQYAVIDRDFVVVEVTKDHDAAEQAALDVLGR